MELHRLGETPCFVNGIITPCDNLQIQSATLTRKPIMVHASQPVAIMKRLNQVQLDMI